MYEAHEKTRFKIDTWIAKLRAFSTMHRIYRIVFHENIAYIFMDNLHAAQLRRYYVAWEGLGAVVTTYSSDF